MSPMKESNEKQAQKPAVNQIIEGSTSGQPRALNHLSTIPIPTTPLRRASSAGPPSTHSYVRRASGARLGSAKRPVAVTPHGRAARRELELRRGLTPGKDRRRSGLQQRETPRDVLRQLSRILAPKTLPTVPTPQARNNAGSRRLAEEEDPDDENALPRPRFSLPGFEEDEDEDDSLLLPPHSAGLEDENLTIQSVERARRAISEQPPRLSRGSFGSVRLSDVFADLNESGLGRDDYDSSYLAERTFGDLDFPVGEDGVLDGENTDTIRGLDRARFSLAGGRESDIRPDILPGDDTETTFAFNVPPKGASEEPMGKRLVEDVVEHLLKDPEVSGDEEPVEELEDELEVEGLDGVEAGHGDESRLDVTGTDLSMADTTMQEAESAALVPKAGKKKKVKLSKHGLEYPSLPAGVVKKLATKFARTSGNSKAKINKETLEAIMQASDWFFEQVSDDLGAYATHAGRKTIDESDMVTLMARQRQTNSTTTPFSLAQRYLPRELLQELRMVPPPKLKKGRQLNRIEEEE
ncbi:uncharacterized protein L3040_005976 [Drepanopeziza brunnea f. sp. 'multigermtubi']|uniref:CENP-T/Histone H4 histone fold domain-containing protein n=1 Tax=Marssonina brunnea f. sp. multigermtubi (strain MB_m1) TaxID=1072389 RepID=K1WTD5_MARBU|nr:uncharacterized protein MBM_06305 [Drepanopeziza brunnea f. sp. 'multigermtubi' MB_m1]EKD15677.1 hypothetical protein MBM_06305 [Drepanopeziza brunnea f. sp. 'multigermtubi' MB_m1]KAJ5040319.1 hypothetical protein L3040_005976 [Drepanopeziza brunnea f. sp. 'multigermtubi']